MVQKHAGFVQGKSLALAMSCREKGTHSNKAGKRRYYCNKDKTGGSSKTSNVHWLQKGRALNPRPPKGVGGVLCVSELKRIKVATRGAGEVWESLAASISLSPLKSVATRSFRANKKERSFKTL